MDFTEAARHAGIQQAAAIRSLKAKRRHAAKAVPARIIPGVAGPPLAIPRYAADEDPPSSALGYYTCQQARIDAARIERSHNPTAEYIRLFELRNGLRSTP